MVYNPGGRFGVNSLKRSAVLGEGSSMRKLVLFGALVATVLTVIAFSCTPDIPQTPSATVVQALFDPSASPPIVPTPTDLVFNPATRTLNIPIDPNAKDAEKEFLGYLNSLDGYP